MRGRNLASEQIVKNMNREKRLIRHKHMSGFDTYWISKFCFYPVLHHIRVGVW